ncbi:MAG: imidazole glycerol phosphate synthase subunit HisH [Candidatus Nephthysia bennettiae]|uniref:Imidazole glycerol phosphate synthase subunit HisH n=1 Tax=Candidatus Nephthysia bennettiae TaxID=3127016 RepID=A0A934K7Z7_9BACT|nr:imidazole glycerol phosphate synthase subunit HisH [Candidatus Dormibacteraeota bacterium]MBJ7613875.1 imidazole glycerol phosphate synthase subunit HisH [Candidatus Dormibacteraeota bacterium]PZR95630.1 MAG: imidazole glycerol phosphate synthase subunit HisH [Candidatus Dormibacteraeota bacterium]
MIAIVDYGVGNLRSVERALLHAGASPRLTADLDDLAAANGLVLPGVGAFGPALRKLEQGNLGRWVVEQARQGKPLLGVCLGYQLLFEESEEHGRHQGLGLLSGRVVRVSSSPRLPVIGWCRLKQTEWSPLWQGIEDSSYFYFVHSYTPAGSPQAIAATEHSPAAAAARLNVMGTQFHPEKSGDIGLKVYSNFLEFCGAG